MDDRYDVPDVAIIGAAEVRPGVVYAVASIKASAPGRYTMHRYKGEGNGQENTYPISIVIGADGSVAVERYGKMEVQCSGRNNIDLSEFSGDIQQDEESMCIYYNDISAYIKVRFVDALPNVVHVSVLT